MTVGITLRTRISQRVISIYITKLGRFDRRVIAGQSTWPPNLGDQAEHIMACSPDHCRNGQPSAVFYSGPPKNKIRPSKSEEAVHQKATLFRCLVVG